MGKPHVQWLGFDQHLPWTLNNEKPEFSLFFSLASSLIIKTEFVRKSHKCTPAHHAKVEDKCCLNTGQNSQLTCGEKSVTLCKWHWIHTWGDKECTRAAVRRRCCAQSYLCCLCPGSPTLPRTVRHGGRGRTARRIRLHPGRYFWSKLTCQFGSRPCSAAVTLWPSTASLRGKSSALKTLRVHFLIHGVHLYMLCIACAPAD